MTEPSYLDDLIFSFDTHADARGLLTLAHTAGDPQLPFEVRRVFWITGVPDGVGRGQHAHRTCWEALVAVNGSFNVRIDDGHGHTRCVTLDTPEKGLLIPPMVWCGLDGFTPDAVCLCLASGDYDKEAYISDIEEFRRQAQAL